MLQTGPNLDWSGFCALRSCCKELRTAADHVLESVSFATSDLQSVTPFIGRLSCIKLVTIRTTAAHWFTSSLSFLRTTFPPNQVTHLKLFGTDQADSASQIQPQGGMTGLDLCSLALPWSSKLAHLEIANCGCFVDAHTQTPMIPTSNLPSTSGSNTTSGSNVIREYATWSTFLPVHFLWLRSLELNHVLPKLTAVDVGWLKGLKRLTCVDSMDQRELKIWCWESLEYLDCSNNQIARLDIYRCSALQTLKCSDNGMTHLKLNTCTALRVVRSSHNSIYDLMFETCTSLLDLDCSHNLINRLRLPHTTSLQRLNCSHNRLKGLKVHNQAGLRDLECSFNRLSGLSLVRCSRLETLDISGNAITSLDFSPCAVLQRLDCHNSEIKGLHLAANTSLLYLDCSGNDIRSLQLSSNTCLMHINCSSNNKIRRFDFARTPTLQFLDYANTGLHHLDVSQCTGLLHLNF